MPRRSGEPREVPPTPPAPMSVQTLAPMPGSMPKPVPGVAPAGQPKPPPQTKLTAEQVEAWIMYEAIGEIGQAVRARAALVSGCQFYIGLPPDADNVDGRRPRDTNGVALVNDLMLTQAEEFLSLVVDSSGSQRGLIRAQSENWDVAGAGVMLAWYERADGTRTTEMDPLRERLRFEFVGAGEYREDGGRKYVKLKPGGSDELLPPDTAAWRMWRRHPRYMGAAMSWVLGVLPIARNLLAFQLAERSQALSAAVGTVHLVPSDAAPKKPLQEGQDPATPRATMTAEEYGAHLDEMLGDVIAEVVDDWQSGRTVQGGVLAVEGQFIEKFGKKIEIGRPIDQALGSLTDRALTRLKESADIAPEMLSGLGDTNRWNGAQIDDTEYRRYHRPHLMAMADDWTTALLWPYLIGLGWAPSEVRQLRILVGTQGVVADPDRSKDAQEALTSGAIGWDGYRVMRNIPDEFKPSDEEREQIRVFLGKAAAPGAGGSGPPAEVIPVNEAAGSRRIVASASTVDLSTRLQSIEASTRQALAAAGAVAMDAALARAGSKMANLARRHTPTLTLTGSGLAILQQLPPDARRSIADAEFGADERRRREEMFAAALLLLQRHFTDITTDALHQTLDALGIDWPTSTVPGRSPFTGATISAADIAAAVDSGWNVLDESLTDWADATVFGDDPLEHAPEVPAPVWRRSMAAVGGAVVASGFGPIHDHVPGLTSGPRLAILEPPVEGYVWWYGSPGTRRDPFSEHAALDGEPITGPDDEVLAGAPWGSYWPGDHTGCQCDVVPTFAPSTE